MTGLHPAERSRLANRMAYRPVYSHGENSDHRFTHNCGRLCVKYKTSETPKIDNIFIYLRFDYISVIIRINVYPDDDWNIVET